MSEHYFLIAKHSLFWSYPLIFQNPQIIFSCVNSDNIESPHLVHLERFWETGSFSPLGPAHLGICEHSNGTVMQNKTSKPRSPRRDGVCLLSIKPWSGSFTVRNTITATNNWLALSPSSTNSLSAYQHKNSDSLLTISIQFNISRRAGASCGNVTGLDNICWHKNCW